MCIFVTNNEEDALIHTPFYTLIGQ